MNQTRDPIQSPFVIRKLTPQVICRHCDHASSVGLAPDEAAEIIRCLWFEELRCAGWVRRCNAFKPAPPAEPKPDGHAA
jgi:hypothetical protein